MLALRFSRFPFALFLLSWIPLACSQESPFNTLREDLYSEIAQSSGGISGTVVTTTHGASEILVNIKSVTSGFSRRVLTDRFGHFEIQGLSTGTYVVSVEEPGHTPACATAFVNGNRIDISLDLRPVNAAPAPNPRYIVSVRELSIPENARQQYSEGLRRIGQQDFQGSLKFFQKAIQKFPDFYEAYYHLGFSQMRLDQKAQAGESFQSAINISGGNYPWAEFAYALLLCEQGRIAEAEQLVRHGLFLDPNTADGYVVLGVVMLHLHRPDEAEKSAREALARNANSSDAYLVLADVHSQTRNYSAAVKDLDAFLRLEPNTRRTKSARALRGAAARLATETAFQRPN